MAVRPRTKLPKAPKAPKVKGAGGVVKAPKGVNRPSSGRFPKKAKQYQRFVAPDGTRYQYIGGQTGWVRTGRGAPPGGGAPSPTQAGAAAVGLPDSSVPNQDTGVAPGVTGGATGGATGGGETGGATAPKAKTDQEIADEVQALLAAKEPGYSASITDLFTQLGFGYGGKDGTGYAGAGDILGLPGSDFDPKNFVIRDALGRPVDVRSLLTTDVFGGKAKTDIAGTALGDLVLETRRAAARAAEGRSASGVRGGAASAQRQQETVGQEAGITGLLQQLLSGITGVQKQRQEDISEAQDTVRDKDPESYAPEDESDSGDGGGGGGEQAPPAAGGQPSPGKPKYSRPRNVPAPNANRIKQINSAFAKAVKAGKGKGAVAFSYKPTGKNFTVQVVIVSTNPPRLELRRKK